MTSEAIQLTLRAAAQIRGLIMDGVLLPGEKLRQLELAERIGVSRSPLREALRTLESEGMLSYEANRGYVVARLEQGDVAEILRANRDFHFTIFELSPMRQYKREITRLWQLSEGYRGWWWRLP